MGSPFRKDTTKASMPWRGKQIRTVSLRSRGAIADNVTRMLPNLKERFRTLVGNLAATPHHHVAKAREALKSLLGKTIALHPCTDGAGRYLTAEVTGDYEGLLWLAIGKNKAGGGQGS